jgi:hypothetical protein
MAKRFLVAAVVAVVVSLDSRAADLTAIKRVIAKEPVYQGRPRYCLLVFGPEAKTRIWMVRDDRNLYVDCEGTGDLTKPGAKVNGEFSGYVTIANIGVPDGNRKNLTLQSMGDQFRLTLGTRGEGGQYVGIGLMERPVWGDKAENAPIIHFDGPMALAQYGPPVNMPRSGIKPRSTSLRLLVGTPGLGKGTFASYDEICASDFGPVDAEITYTSAADKAKTFTERCELFHDG